MSDYISTQSQEALLSTVENTTGLRGSTPSRLTHLCPQPLSMDTDAVQSASNGPPSSPLNYPSDDEMADDIVDGDMDTAKQEDSGYDADDDSRDSAKAWYDQSFIAESPRKENSFDNSAESNNSFETAPEDADDIAHDEDEEGDLMSG
ncbi:hypothetical protein ABW21_db0205844 [Orbilia brochopaga]|nr:hypothetical protein ABW21_db0205844 [Drechslerella brochopaga]